MRPSLLRWHRIEEAGDGRSRPSSASSAKSVPLATASPRSGASSQLNRTLRVMRFHGAEQAEPQIGETFPHAADQGVDGSMAAALHQRIDVAGVLGPGARDQRVAAGRVGFVPGGDVLADRCSVVSCMS